MHHHTIFADLATALAQPRSWFVVMVAIGAGMVRGFSGFGGAQIFIPLASAALEPKAAVPLFYMCDMFTASPYGLRFLRECRWSEIAPLIAGSWLVLPLGALLLRSFDPVAMRWAIDVLVFLIVILLVSGWRYRRRPTPPISFLCGAGAGLTGGATGLSGPLVIAYWLGSGADAVTSRMNIMVFYSMNSLYTDVIYFFEGLFTRATFIHAIFVGPAYGLGLWSGVRLFRGASDKHYRSVAFVLIIAAAAFGSPLFDHWLR